VDERVRRGGKRTQAVLRPFYRQWPCGDREGKWGARGATRQREAREGGMVSTGRRRPDQQWPDLGARGRRGGCQNRGA
jgi:hypothetical protein